MLAFKADNNFNSIKACSIFLIWFAFSSVYLILVNTHFNTIAGCFSLIIQVGLDAALSILAFKLYQTTYDREKKNIYLMFFIAAISAAIADGIYHLAMNILDIDYFNKANSLFEIPFIFFLLFLLIAWIRIFFTAHEANSSKKLSYLPYLSVSVFIFFAFVYIIPWKIHYLSKLGIYQLIDTVLEVLGFALSTICLARAKNNPVRYLSIGYLFVISSDLLIRYDVVTGNIPFLSIFEVSWSFGLLIMAFGFFSLKSNPIKLLPLNSLQSHMAIWLLNLLSLFVFLFLSANYFFPQKDVSNSLLLIIVPCSLFSVIFSEYFASRILLPLERLELMIKEFLMEGPTKYASKMNPSSTDIDDFILLEKFIHEAFDLYKKNHSIKMEYAAMATQVAHDIKSPMIALNNYFKEAVQLNQMKYNVVESSLHRINEIANTLLIQYKKTEIDPRDDINDLDLISFFLDSLIEEKKLQYKACPVEFKVCIDPLAETTYTSFNAANFKRTVSNLINNAIESVKVDALIIISLQKKMDSLILEISDNGCGIATDTLKNIEQGKAIKKTKGTGLGLPYALKSIQAWGAQYKIHSKKDSGTQFQIIFPVQNPPHWVQDVIYTYDDLTIVIVDDDYSIFKLWEEKLANIDNRKFNFLYLDSPHGLEGYIKDRPAINKHLFLIDYHFNHSELTGIELIESLCLKNAVLVTNRYPDSYIKESEIKLILKKNIPFITIRNIDNKPDLILVDDQKLVTDMWEMESQKHGKKIVAFNRKDLFMEYISLVDKNTHIYLDLNLDQDNGNEIAKNLYLLGYKRLYITTGYDLKHIHKSPWVLEIIGKVPPFSKFSMSKEK